jgi:NADPH-dependent glutamate synthase beta subunit-like oxidoreductase/ferredoxin
MPRITVNQQAVEVPPGSTVLDACRKLGIGVPTLCHLDGLKPSTSCMLCVVKDRKTGKLLPSCTAPCRDGLDVETDTDEIRIARRTALELLLSDHLGDCEAPCQRVCPAHMNIPLMIRQIREGAFSEALVTVKRDIALPAVLGWVCPAPCERGCRRGQIDKPVSICLLKRFAATVDLEGGKPFRPECMPPSGMKVAIVGAGPAGLSAAYYLARMGHSCTVFDKAKCAGGALRTAIPEDKLPGRVLDAEIDRIRELGVQFRFSTEAGVDITPDDLRASFGAVVIAVGAKGWDGFAQKMGLHTEKRGIAVKAGVFATRTPGVFAGGGCTGAPQMAVRACGDGKDLAVSVDQYLRGADVTGPSDLFNSTLGRLKDPEKTEFLKNADSRGRVEPSAGIPAGFTPDEARAEAGRCLHCDCRKPLSCKLREYSDEYGARQSRYKPAERGLTELLHDHPEIVVERGKCILCGICVQVAREHGESLGVGFVRRGIGTRVSVPFGKSFADGLLNAGVGCAKACPTGALSLRSAEDSAGPRLGRQQVASPG